MGDRMTAPRPPRGVRPGSLGAELTRRALSSFYGCYGRARAAVCSGETVSNLGKAPLRFFRLWGGQRE